MDVGEGGFFLFLGDGAGGAVGLVADGEVEGEVLAAEVGALGLLDAGFVFIGA